MSLRDKRRGSRRWWSMALIAMTLAGLPVWAWSSLPGRLRLIRDEAAELHLRLPVAMTVRSTRNDVLQVNGAPAGTLAQRVNLGLPVRMAAVGPGQAELDFRLFGLIPLRRTAVEIVPPLRLLAGGHSVGVLIRSQGVMVTGHAPVHGDDGQVRYPAREAGVEVGDVIVRINETGIGSERQLADAVQRLGQLGLPLRLALRRKHDNVERLVWPMRDGQGRGFRVGLYVRDGAAGVGTLTFIDPKTGRYGALGHVISESETGAAIQVQDGHIVRAAVSAIEKGSPGDPGEKIGVFVNEDEWIGSIDKNTRFGIFGTMAEAPANSVHPTPLPVAMAHQVREGPAEIVTVVSGQKLERFEVQILRATRNPGADGRHMIIKITDPKLLSRTRGIVQGMSGSPIIQNGQLVGAVTHVFVNDPARGYGVYLEWMLAEGGLLQPQAVAGSGNYSRSLTFFHVEFRRLDAKVAGIELN